MTGARGGRAEAEERFVRALYDEHSAALGRYVERIVGPLGGADDIVQETFVRAWSRAEQLAADGRPLRPWLVAVARNLAIDRVRTAGVHPTVSDERLADMPAADELDRALQSWEIAEALAALPAEHRSVLVETHYRGRSVAEAASVLGIPPGTVKSRTHYALRMLRLILEERGWTSP
ncbi:MAG: sigma-70 family RNA polymerase sigma factor [Thermoleophilia bacterium]